MVVQHVRLDGAVEENPAYETKVTIYSGRRASEEGPSSRWIVGNREVCMLEKGDGHCDMSVLALVCIEICRENLQIQ